MYTMTLRRTKVWRQAHAWSAGACAGDDSSRIAPLRVVYQQSGSKSYRSNLNFTITISNHRSQPIFDIHRVHKKFL